MIDPKELALFQFSIARKACDLVREKLVGQRVLILSDYNDQPYGRSKPSLRGETATVEGVSFDMDWGIGLRLKDHRLYIPIEEVAFIVEDSSDVR